MLRMLRTLATDLRLCISLDDANCHLCGDAEDGGVEGNVQSLMAGRNFRPPTGGSDPIIVTHLLPMTDMSSMPIKIYAFVQQT